MTAQRRGRNGYAGRRRQKPAPQRQVAQTDSEDESSDEGSVTRCVCGESHNVGLMVQCDQCEVWQHCDCVGLEEQDIPEQYYCEECKPENHSVVKLTHGRVRRSYSSDGRSATSSAADKKAPKKRMTFNSREALMSLEDVLAARNALEFGAYISSPPGSPKGGNENAQDQSTAENKDKGSSSSDKEEKKKNSSDANDNAGSNKEDDDAMEVEVETSRPSPRGKKAKRANSSRSNNNNNNNKNENDLGPNTKPARVEKRGGRGGARRTNSTGSRRGQNSKPRSRTSTPQPGDQSPANNSTSSSSIIEKLSARESSPPAKIRYPSAKMSISEMNRRAKQILEYISSIQVEMATNSNSPCIGKSNNNNSSNDGGNNSVPASSTIATTTTTATTSVTTTVKQEQTTTTAQQETVPSPMEIDPFTKTEETTVIVESNIQQKNGTKPSAIVIPEKREDGPSSSLSSASTLPLEENPSGEAAATATQEHLHKEKSTAEEAIAQSMQEQEAKKEQTSLEIMDMLTRELIKFQRRFGAGSACHGSSKHHHHRSSNKEEDSEGETTTRVTRSQETSANSTSAGTTTTTAAGGGGGLLIEKNAAHA